MKNQYIGDIGDYGKYALLRAFAEEGIRIGINWYLTEEDDSRDGKFTEYLKENELRDYSPELFDELKIIAVQENKSVKDIEDIGIVPGAIYYSDILNPIGTPNDREQERNSWFQESMYELEKTELIYMDPDNGLLVSNEPGRRGAEKYVLPDEVEQYYRAGHNVVYYCQRGRRKPSEWYEYKNIMSKILPDAKKMVLTYHKGTQRSYVFLIHPEDYKKYSKVIISFRDAWNGLFSHDNSSKDDPAAKQVGEKITIDGKDGAVFTIYKRADGWIQVENSKDRNTTRAIRPDVFCDFLWR